MGAFALLEWHLVTTVWTVELSHFEPYSGERVTPNMQNEFAITLKVEDYPRAPGSDRRARSGFDVLVRTSEQRTLPI
jgi:hypothetical protein